MKRLLFLSLVVCVGLSLTTIGPVSFVQAQSTPETEEAESKLIEIINRARVDRRQRSLRYEPRLTQIAQELAQAIYNGESLTSLNEGLEILLRQKGYPHMLSGGRYATTDGSVEEMVGAWLRDSGPDGILNAPEALEIGVAYLSSEGTTVSNMARNIWAVVIANPARPAADGWDIQILQLVNQFRRENGLPPLVMNAFLARAAKAHAQDMFNRDYFEHISLSGTDPGDRATAAGYRWTRVLENLAAGQTTPRDVVKAWIRSKDGHREAMLDPVVEELGVGYVFAPFDEGRIQARHYWAMSLGKAVQ